MTTRHRIDQHPILSAPASEEIQFYYGYQKLTAKAGETISSALMANGIHVFGYHAKDHAPMGLFCANGQCSQCMVLMDGKPVKGCMTLVKADSQVNPINGHPELPEYQQDGLVANKNTPEICPEVLIIGGGPAGLSAAIELGKKKINTLLIDDKNQLGGKLVLQTHRFFGASSAVYAGTRGIDIGKKLGNQVAEYASVSVWLNSTALAVFEGGWVGVFKENHSYILVKPKILLVATGAREKSLAFRGNTLPGIIGAGAFQTLVNRDLIRPCKNLFIIGGGNVGLIAGYHALQAGINVVGLVEALPACGGYKVHEDKLARLGVPIFTSHSVVCAHGETEVEGITIAGVDAQFAQIKGTEKTFACDSILIAVGLDPVNEFIAQAEDNGLPVYAAGDAHEIAEASAAMFSGKIKGNEIARDLGYSSEPVPQTWLDFEQILKARPGKVSALPDVPSGLPVFPVLHCRQEIPCDPCSTVCPQKLITIDQADIRKKPIFCSESSKTCIGCEKCVAICPGLAITLVDYRHDRITPTVSIPYEMLDETIQEGQPVLLVDIEGKPLGIYPVEKIRQISGFDHTRILRVKVDAEIAAQVTGIRIIEPTQFAIEDIFTGKIADSTIICRCERVTAGEIRTLIASGMMDINQIKAISRASMGACGGKTCLNLIRQIYKSNGIPMDKVVEPPKRPLFVEVPVAVLANEENEEGDA